MPVTTNEAKYWCWVLNACGSSQRCWIGLWWGFLHTKLLKAFPYGPVSVSSCWNRRKGINSLEEEWFLKVYCAVRYTAGHFLIRRSDFDSMVWVTSFWAREKQKTSWRQFLFFVFSAAAVKSWTESCCFYNRLLLDVISTKIFASLPTFHLPPTPLYVACIFKISPTTPGWTEPECVMNL